MKKSDYIYYMFLYLGSLFLFGLGAPILGLKPSPSLLVLAAGMSSAAILGQRVTKKAGFLVASRQLWAFTLQATLLATLLVFGLFAVVGYSVGVIDLNAIQESLRARPLAVLLDFVFSIIAPIALANALFFPLGAHLEFKRMSSPTGRPR